jgi:hypothetical protein
VAIHSGGQTVFGLSHIKGITLGAGEEVDKVAGGASGMGVGDRASEGQAAGVYGSGFTVGSLARKGARDGMGNKVSSDKELIEIGMTAEGD